MYAGDLSGGDVCDEWRISMRDELHSSGTDKYLYMRLMDLLFYSAIKFGDLYV